jgi:E3 ubiquitin-protein ligase RFWD3
MEIYFINIHFILFQLSTMDFRTTQFVHIHSKMIRDLAFNPKSFDGLLLSCSLDRMLKITSVISNTVVQRYVDLIL